MSSSVRSTHRGERVVGQSTHKGIRSRNERGGHTIRLPSSSRRSFQFAGLISAAEANGRGVTHRSGSEAVCPMCNVVGLTLLAMSGRGVLVRVVSLAREGLLGSCGVFV